VAEVCVYFLLIIYILLCTSVIFLDIYIALSLSKNIVDFIFQNTTFQRLNSVSESCVLENKQDSVLDIDRKMKNVHKHNICTNIPSSQISNLIYILLIEYRMKLVLGVSFYVKLNNFEIELKLILKYREL
jgi:hypothetical protein